MQDTIEGLPCQRKISELTPQQKENLQRWLQIMWTRLEHGLGRALFVAGVLDAPTPEQEQKMMKIIWNSLFRVPLWEILQDEEAARAFIEGDVAPTTMEDIFQWYKDA